MPKPAAVEDYLFASASPVLSSLLSAAEGELVSVNVRIEPWLLEHLLEALATLSFPINPEIVHGNPTTVLFPAYRSRLQEVRSVLSVSGFSPRIMNVSSMLETIAAAS